MKFKADELIEQFACKITPKMRFMVCDLECYTLRMYKKEITVTDLMRPNDAGSVHAYGRGADIRSWMFTDVEIAEMKFYINTKYPYDGGKKPAFLYHTVADGAFHIHLQCEDNLNV